MENPEGFILFPLVVHTLDLVVSAAGILSITQNGAHPPALLLHTVRMVSITQSDVPSSSSSSSYSYSSSMMGCIGPFLGCW